MVRIRPARLLASPKLGAALIAAILACLLLSFLIPQRAIVGEEVYGAWAQDIPLMARVADALTLNAIFSSYLFFAISALLAMNVIACTSRRIDRLLRRRAGSLTPPPTAKRLDLGGQSLSATPTAPRGWTLGVGEGATWVFERGRIGFWGSIVFHLGLLVLIAAGVVSGLTRFSGEVVITEGQTITDTPDYYLSVSQSPRWGRAFTGAPLTLERLDFTYSGDTITDAVAHMRVGDARRAGAGRVNEPVRVAGKAYLLSKSGYAVGLRIAREGATFFDSVVNLGTSVPEGYQDVVSVGGNMPDLVVTAVNDRRVAVREQARQRMVLADPVVRIEARGAETTLQLAPGESGGLDALTLTVTDVRRWNSFLVRGDAGLPIAYAGFLFLLVGAIARWADPEALVVVSRDGTGDGVHVWSFSRYGRALAEQGERQALEALGIRDGGQR